MSELLDRIEAVAGGLLSSGESNTRMACKEILQKENIQLVTWRQLRKVYHLD